MILVGYIIAGAILAIVGISEGGDVGVGLVVSGVALAVTGIWLYSIHEAGAAALEELQAIRSHLVQQHRPPASGADE